MKFLYYDLIFLAIFSLIVGIFLFKRRKNIVIESKIFVLYKTKVGLKFIDWVGKRFKKTFKYGIYILIVFGFMFMIIGLFSLAELLITAIKIPALLKIAKVPPIMPLIPYLPQIFNVPFLPPLYFTYWIITIAITAIFHEFAHGILAKHSGVKIKSTGFFFMGPFFGAFVEPDEKQVAKKSKKAQLAIFAAGSFANAVVTVMFLVLFLVFYSAFFVPAGVTFDTYIMGEINISSISMIHGITFSNPSMEEISAFLSKADDNYYVDLSVKTDYEAANLTKIVAADKTYFTTITNIKEQIKEIKKLNLSRENHTLVVFDDMPALRAGIFGPITSINSVETKNMKELQREMKKYNPGNVIVIEIMNKSYETKKYSVILAENPENKSEGVLGIAFVNTTIKSRRLISRIISIADSINKKLRGEHIFYKPKYDVGITVFIYNLLWWVIVINISVAIMNMLPLGIFDGGRFFYITMLAITKSKKKAAWIFKAITLAILFLFLFLTILWWVVI